jgi:hypothetical protein
VLLDHVGELRVRVVEVVLQGMHAALLVALLEGVGDGLVLADDPALLARDGVAIRRMRSSCALTPLITFHKRRCREAQTIAIKAAKDYTADIGAKVGIRLSPQSLYFFDEKDGRRVR